MIQVILDKPPKGFFEKLGQSPWEERCIRAATHLLKAAAVLGALWILLHIDALINIYKGIPS